MLVRYNHWQEPAIKLYEPEEFVPWIGEAERIFREEGAATYPCEAEQGDHQLWLREFALGSWALTCDVTPEEYVTNVQAHFDYLEQAGVALPSLEMQVREQSFSQPDAGTTLYVATDHVDYQSPEFIRGPEIDQASRELSNALHEYVYWVSTSPQRLALFDVLRLRQYGYGSLADGEKKLYLLDVEPALAVTQDARHATYSFWQDRVAELGAWTSKLIHPGSA